MKELKTLIVNGNEYTVTDPNAARIDDAAAGRAVWSSKNMIDRLCPAFTESGAVVTCEPVAGYPLEVVSHIRPVQTGSGAPSPENVRPITGHTQAQLTMTNGTDTREFSLDLGRTVYSGSMNWNTGVLTVDSATFIVNGTESWAQNSIYNGNEGLRYDCDISTELLYEEAECICSHYPYTLPNQGRGIWAYPRAGKVGLRIIWTYETADQLKTHLLEQYAAGTPVQICCPLATPVIVQLAAQEILALSGTNNLYSNTGDTEATGKANPSAVIKKLTNAIIALGGNV